MTKEDTGGGILSRMVKFVRNPTTNWSDLDTMAESRDSQHSKQMLKAMIERKRRNDFVRKREFDMLRKLRSRITTPDPGYGGRPSFFQSSYSSRPDDRAGTLKKIDEIEAQMSMQWWRAKEGDARGNPQTLPPPDKPDPRRAYRTTVPVGGAGTTMPMTQPLSTVMGNPGAPTPTPAPPARPAAPTRSIPGRDAGPTAPMDMEDERDSTAFSASKFYALDVQELALDPDIEEAAIRFASGDDNAAEQGLLDVLARKEGGGTPDEWMALFDLYRATGRLEGFESRAIDFASRFSQSAPQWFSMIEEVARRSGVAKMDSSALSRAHWVADDKVTPHAITVLTRVLERTPQPWVLDWTALQSIDPAACAPLIRLFGAWANQAVDLRFVGARNLRERLAASTPSGNRGVDRACWDLRLAVLRAMGMGDDFELAALDFCVTYEVSPPSWEAPRCSFKSLQGAPKVPTAAPGGREAPPPAFVESVLSSLPPDAVDTVLELPESMSEPAAELMGEILGDAQSDLDEVDQRLAGVRVMVVSCRYLVRVDFSAAGSILNWASSLQAQGREIRFVDVHRLVSAFFHVIGITEHAKVVARKD